jgi:PhnB protein
MTTIAPASTAIATAVTPYLAVHDGAAALDWYAEAFGGVEHMRVVGDDGRLGHAEFHVGDAVFYLSDEYPDMGVVSPRTLGGTTFALHLQVTDVDARFGRAIAAGATPLHQPEDQPHGARHGTLVDPFGHRWMLSQQVEQLSVDEYAARTAGSGFEVVGAEIPGAAEGETITAADRAGTGGGIWAGVFYDDARAAIRFLVDTFGFEEQLVVVGPDDRTVVHSQLRWPEGGVVQVGSYDPGNQFSHAPGDQSLYVVTADPQWVWQRSQAAGLEVVRAPESPDYDPEGMGFTVRDPEGNIWSFGNYGLGEAS